MSAEHSPLPWRVQHDGDDTEIYDAGSLACQVARVFGGRVRVSEFARLRSQRRANAEYIVRACNAFPDLLASLRELHAFAAACMRVVVKPEHAACAAALDAEVAAAGIAEGYGIRAQEAIEKATVTHG
jgi:hypothetical protein